MTSRRYGGSTRALAHGSTSSPGARGPGGGWRAAWGDWTCKGGALDGQECDPLDLGLCGEGVCGSEPKRTIACIGISGPMTRMVDEKLPDLTALVVGVSRDLSSALGFPDA